MLRVSKLNDKLKSPKGFYFLSAFFNFLDGLANMILYPFGYITNISVTYHKKAFKTAAIHYKTKISEGGK